jgi:alpha-beta hydrolase superfamily lysophospholipase
MPSVTVADDRSLCCGNGHFERVGDLDNVERKVYEGLGHETFNEPEGADTITWIDAHL